MYVLFSPELHQNQESTESGQAHVQSASSDKASVQFRTSVSSEQKAYRPVNVGPLRRSSRLLSSLRLA